MFIHDTRLQLVYCNPDPKHCTKLAFLLLLGRGSARLLGLGLATGLAGDMASQNKRKADSESQGPARVIGKQPPAARQSKAAKSQALALEDLTRHADAEASHPTLAHLRNALADSKVQTWLADHRANAGYGGIESFNEDNFLAAMRSVGQYTCCINAQSIDATTVTHKGLIPSLVSVEKVKSTIWARDKRMLWSEPVHVAVFSKSQKPTCLIPLNQDVARMAFWRPSFTWPLLWSPRSESGLYK